MSGMRMESTRVAFLATLLPTLTLTSTDATERVTFESVRQLALNVCPAGITVRSISSLFSERPWVSANVTVITRLRASLTVEVF